MNEENSNKISRRKALATGLAAFAAAGFSGRAAAQQKIAQSLVMYQDKPKDGHECDQCVQFIPPGSCKVVDGKIFPHGWCAVFAAKPK